jgi:hypothetical protein
MSLSRSQRITDNFYQWEQLGRGWHLFNAPVELEPEFIPFTPASFVGDDDVVDETFRPSLFTKAVNLVTNALSPQETLSEEVEPNEPIVQAHLYQSDESLESFSISFPHGEKPFKALDIEKFLTMLSFTNSTVCFEIVAWNDLIRLQFVCGQSDTAHIQSQIKAYFPTCILQNGTSYINNIIDGEKYCSIVDFGLEEEYMRHIAMADKFDSDPLTGLYGVLDHLEDGEQAVIQILFKGTLNPWAQSIMQSVSDAKGESTFSNAPEMPKLALEKISAPLFGVGIRILGQDYSYEKAHKTGSKVATALMQSSKSIGNKLIPLNNNHYSDEDHLRDVTLRQTRRLGMLLNAKELGTFVHYPLAITAKKLETDIRKTKRAPNIAWGSDYCLGTNSHQGFEGIVTLYPQQRLKHMHVIGATGTGKSTMLQSLIVQDILLGNNIAVLDPHGDLIESILPYIPESRYDDVIIIDPADSEFPVGFNILTAHSDIEKEILASDLVAVFRRLSTSFGDQMHSVLANAILAFVESTEGGTLIDLRRFLIEKPFREQFLKTVSDPSVVYYWQKEYPILKSNSVGSILTRLDSFLRPKLIRNMVAQKKSLDFESIMDSKKILLIKLSQGLIGTENSYLLGSFLVSKIYQSAMARQALSKDNRTSFYMYVDEFQNFITPSMSSILSGTRKYGLGCILAHQDMSQLQKYDTELANSVISNAGTRVCFRVGDIDAKRLSEGFSSFEAQDIQNLGVGQAIARIERPEYDFTMSTLVLNDVPIEQAQKTKQFLISLSRAKYGTEKQTVEQSLEYLKDTTLQEKEILQSKGLKKDISLEAVIFNKEVSEETAIHEIIQTIKPQEIVDNKTKDKLVKQQDITEHRYTQMYVKKMAEARGFTAKLEALTPSGGGRVDVLLERNGKTIACEIGMTTTKDWEVHNIIKCIEAGYDEIISIVKDGKFAASIAMKIASALDPKLVSRIKVFELAEFINFLDKLISPEPIEQKIKGYRVKVNYASSSEQDVTQKKAAISKILIDAKNKDSNETKT